MKDKLIDALIRTRLSQVLINEEYKKGIFKIPVHLSFGHEAIAVAVSETLQGDDKLLLSHRNMSYNLVRSGNLRAVLDEYYLNNTGLAKGRLGSMNLMNREKNIIYSSSILANNFSVAAGVAMAEKLKNKGGFTIVLGGDGSMEEGSFYESLVMMKSLELPALVIIENNEWSLGTHVSERRKPIYLQQLCSAVDIEYLRLEGNDTDDYIMALAALRKKIIAGNDPVCVEVILKTLGDRRNPPTPEYPEGKYINYHAGPSPTVDVNGNLYNVILRESSDDPVFVLCEKIGMEKLGTITKEIMAQLKSELV